MTGKKKKKKKKETLWGKTKSNYCCMIICQLLIEETVTILRQQTTINSPQLLVGKSRNLSQAKYHCPQYTPFNTKISLIKNGSKMEEFNNCIDLQEMMMNMSSPPTQRTTKKWWIQIWLLCAVAIKQTW